MEKVRKSELNNKYIIIYYSLTKIYSLNYNPNIGMNVNSRPFDEGRIFLKYLSRGV